jgi:hypothetical protein
MNKFEALYESLLSQILEENVVQGNRGRQWIVPNFLDPERAQKIVNTLEIGKYQHIGEDGDGSNDMRMLQMFIDPSQKPQFVKGDKTLNSNDHKNANWASLWKTVLRTVGRNLFTPEEVREILQFNWTVKGKHSSDNIGRVDRIRNTA